MKEGTGITEGVDRDWEPREYGCRESLPEGGGVGGANVLKCSKVSLGVNPGRRRSGSESSTGTGAGSVLKKAP